MKRAARSPRYALGVGSILVAIIGAAPLACSDDDPAATSTPPPPPSVEDDGGSPFVDVQLLAINDFHGNLEPPEGSSASLLAHADDPALAGRDVGPRGDAGGGAITVRAGGAAYLAATVRALRAGNPSTVLVSAGDLSGASPLLSSLFHDEPSVLAMNALGLDLNAVGNHELDRGPAEVLRLQSGGCHPVDGCAEGQPPFAGAKFRYLAANVNTALNQTLFPPYEIRTFDGEKLAFIGMTLEDTASIVSASAVEGLTFGNEVTTVNALVPELRQANVSGIVVVVHQGSVQAEGATYDECGVTSGPIAEMAKKLDPAVDVVVSAHTHEPYVCELSGKLVTSAASFGRVVTKIDLTIDKAAHRITKKAAKNVPVTRDKAPDPEVASIVSTYASLAAPLANRVVGQVTGDLSVAQDPLTGESVLGNVIADAQLEATTSTGAVIALTNPGGIRADIVYASQGADAAGEVTYAEAFAVQPFSNVLVTMTLTGAQVRALLESQFAAGGARMLQISSSLSYAFSASAPVGSRVDAASIRIDGVAVDPAASYRVTVNGYLAGGGDGFVELTKGTDRVNGPLDADALVTYLGAHKPLPPPAKGRITRLP